MGSKLFRFNKNANGPVVPVAEEAARPAGGKAVASRMRDLIKRDGSADQKALLMELESSEGASRFQEHSVDLHSIAAEPVRA